MRKCQRLPRIHWTGFHWLLGTWTKYEGTKFSKEEWRRENDSTYSGYSFVKIENDTVFAEDMLLHLNWGEVFLTVADVDSEHPHTVSFKLVSDDDLNVVFQNDKNAFPSEISYSHPAPDSLSAWIKGVVDGSRRRFIFPIPGRSNQSFV